MPPTLVTLGWAMSMAPASISVRKPNSAGGVLAGRQGNAVAAQAGEAGGVLGRPDRFFKPEQAVGGEGGGHVARLGGCPGAVDVQHDRRVGRRGPGCQHRLAGHFVQFDVAVALGAGVGGVARDEFEVVAVGEQAGIGVELVRRAAAEQAPDWLAGPFAEQVPQCDLDAREGIDEGAVAAQQMHRVQRLAGERVDVTGLPADDQRGHDGVERRLGGGDGGMAEGLAPADQAVVGLDLDQEDFKPIPGLSGERRVRASHREGEGND